MTIVIYTADCGSHDDIWPPEPQRGDVEFVRFDSTDPPVASYGWSWHLPADRHPPGLPDRLAARWYKQHPWALFPGADVTIWVDASLRVTSPAFAADLAELAPPDGFALYRHPDRDTVAAEIAAADTLPRCAGNTHAAMVTALADVCPVRPGLWALGVIARRHGPRVEATDGFVWDVAQAWTGESVPSDQLIWPFAVEWSGVPVVDDLPGTLWDSPWFERQPHRRGT